MNVYETGSNKTIVDSVVEWIGEEVVVYNTPMCWRQTYDRGVGLIPTACPTGKVNNAGLCYDACISGFSDHGTATCTRNCPSGYTDTGLLCHFNGIASYSPVHWDNCATHAPQFLGGGCIGGLVEDACKAGYHKIASVCYIDVPAGFSGSGLDPIKGGTYSRVGTIPTCLSPLVKDTGLCYQPPRTGFSCSLTACQRNCASGTVTCGAGACSTDATTCALNILNMAIAPLAVILNVMTSGTAGTAVKAVDTAAQNVNKASKLAKAASAVEKVGYLQSLQSFEDTLATQIKSLMAAAQNNLASVTNSNIATTVANKYTIGSANYKSIANKWTQIYLVASFESFATALRDQLISMADPTGVIGLIQAFTQPKCEQHSTIP